MRTGSHNPNWKGGISSVKTADHILDLPSAVQQVLRARLLSAVKKDKTSGCWNWLLSTFNKRYARFSVGKAGITGHTASFVLFKGTRIDGRCVLHDCDNMRCVNPDHLLVGTFADNSRDMTNKKRQAHGERNGGAKLTRKQVRWAISQVKSRKTQRWVAKKLRVNYNTINRIIKGHSWKYANDKS